MMHLEQDTHFLSTVGIKDSKVKIDGKNDFDKPAKMISENMKTLEALQLVKETMAQLTIF